ncbi:DUF4124 domain-containing protein [Ramlibacter algicola]|uniref:DUF4124 domain-containing protein n=1 Tax=Ramlibacter algicola TaxID=2795217 RepID=A0A934Q254_9BURK|nr:DUF4124 domain-containing protein [Ramlibacter algicola]MBK0393408.1 DUF4124 domain-containing protein [Ramlibacter algicola]
MNALRALAVVACCALPLAAVAQWQWIDKDGRRVFSDKSPPPEIPARNILKAPNGRALPVEPEAPAAAATAAAQPASGALKVSGKDKALEEKKKQAEAAEAEKKKAAEREFAEKKAENCKRAKEAKATLDSGIRLSRVNDKGEREVLDDAQRAVEGRRLDEAIATNCVA